MLTVPGIDPKRITCDDGDIKRVRLDSTVVAYLSPNGGFWFDGNWFDGNCWENKAVLKVVIPEWLASDGTRLWPEPPPDLLEVAKEMLLMTYSKDIYLRLAKAVAAEEAKRAAVKEPK